MTFKIASILLVLISICHSDIVEEPADKWKCLEPEMQGDFLRFYGFKQRPSFKAYIVNEFKNVHCTEINGNISPNCIANLPLELCHVISWDYIKTFVVQKLEACYYETMQLEEPCDTRLIAQLNMFVELVFEYDYEAVVNNKYVSFPWTQKDFVNLFPNLEGYGYLNQFLISFNDEFKRHIIVKLAQIRDNLLTEIKSMKNKETSKFIKQHNYNANEISSLFQYLNSAPANLRFGHPNVNSAIGSSLDPMGDRNQQLTVKERQWMNTEEYYDGGEWCSTPMKLEDTNFYLSSTGPVCGMIDGKFKCILDSQALNFECPRMEGS